MMRWIMAAWAEPHAGGKPPGRQSQMAHSAREAARGGVAHGTAAARRIRAHREMRRNFLRDVWLSSGVIRICFIGMLYFQ